MKKKTLIIAEAGVNHNGDINLAKKLIDAAAAAGVDFVKFQTFKTENLVSKSAKKADYQIANLNDGEDTQFNMLKKLELDLNMHNVLIDYCEKKNIKFLSTAFDLDSIDMLLKLNIPFFKIPSGEITNLPYLKKIASTNKPVIISTGMTSLGEVVDAVGVFKSYGYSDSKISILHCNTEYPTPFEDVNLLAMDTIKRTTNLEVGYSDHTLGIEVPIAAVALGATIIEKHFTLDRNLPGPDHKASLEPVELMQMVNAIRHIELALGSEEKTPSKSESKNRLAARKSIHLKNSMETGQEIHEIDLIMLRPGDGISPMKMASVIGKRINKNVESGYKLQMKDLM